MPVENRVRKDHPIGKLCVLSQIFRSALAVFAVACRSAVADVVGYSEAYDTLFKVNLTQLSAQVVGPATPSGSLRYPIIDGLTFSPSGELYAVADGGVNTLLRISATTGHATPVGIVNLGTKAEDDIGLAFTADGRLWLSTVQGDLWQVDSADASVTLIGKFGDGVRITGLVSRGNTLFGAGAQGDENALYQIDLDTAHATPLSAYSGVPYVTAASPAFGKDGELWLLLDYVPPLRAPTPNWSDLASRTADGNVHLIGSVTAPPHTSSYDELVQVGLRGLALSAPEGITDISPVPTLRLIGKVALSLLVCGASALWISRHLRHSPTVLKTQLSHNPSSERKNARSIYARIASFRDATRLGPAARGLKQGRLASRQPVLGTGTRRAVQPSIR